MRLRRKTSTAGVSTGRRQRRQTPDSPQNARPFAYRSRRAEQEPNIGRQLSREAGGGAAPRPAGKNFVQFLLQRFGLIVLLVALIISVANVLSVSDNARIVSLGSSSSFLQDSTVYQQAADRILAGSIWNRNKITINTDDISRQLLRQFPELSSASVTLPLVSKRPTVYVQAAQPALILSSKDGSFVIDTSGKALLHAASLPAASQASLPLVTDQSGLDVALNRQVLPANDVSFMQTVAAELAARHIGIASMTLPGGTSELDVHLAGLPYIVKFNLENNDSRQQAGTFLATQSKLQSQHITPSQYIDVRVDGRAYYK